MLKWFTCFIFSAFEYTTSFTCRVIVLLLRESNERNLFLKNQTWLEELGQLYIFHSFFLLHLYITSSYSLLSLIVCVLVETRTLSKVKLSSTYSINCLESIYTKIRLFYFSNLTFQMSPETKSLHLDARTQNGEEKRLQTLRWFSSKLGIK